MGPLANRTDHDMSQVLKTVMEPLQNLDRPLILVPQ
jgi:hypothetical protein